MHFSPLCLRALSRLLYSYHIGRSPGRHEPFPPVGVAVSRYTAVSSVLALAFQVKPNIILSSDPTLPSRYSPAPQSQPISHASLTGRSLLGRLLRRRLLSVSVKTRSVVGTFRPSKQMKVWSCGTCLCICDSRYWVSLWHSQ